MSENNGKEASTSADLAGTQLRVTQERAITVQELTDIFASTMRSSQPLSQAPASGSSQYFSACRLQKTDNFPPLYVEKNASPHRLNPDSATYWIFDIANWASAHGLHNIFDLCNVLITISADGSQRLPLFPDQP
jgi:hypothetical protein